MKARRRDFTVITISSPAFSQKQADVELSSLWFASAGEKEKKKKVQQLLFPPLAGQQPRHAATRENITQLIT